MHLNIIARILGLLLMIFSLTMLPPILVAVLYGENTSSTFAIAFGITLAVGLAFWLPSKQVDADMRTRDGFLITVLLLASAQYLWCPAADAGRRAQPKLYQRAV